jgi:hypothetical protein
MIRSITGRFSNPPKYVAEQHQWQGPIEMFLCPVAPQWCDEDCDHCLEFVTTCDACHCAGHQDSPGWNVVMQLDGQPRVLCDDCYSDECRKG